MIMNLELGLSNDIVDNSLRIFLSVLNNNYH